MRRIIAAISLFIFAFAFFVRLLPVSAFETPRVDTKLEIEIPPKACPQSNSGKFPEFCEVYLHTDYLNPASFEKPRDYDMRKEQCVESIDQFKENPYQNHYWVEDPRITAQGKADERARQFIFWTVSKQGIDDHPTLKRIWSTSRNIALFLTIVVAAILGIGIIIGQRMQFDLKVQVWPVVIKITTALAYIIFSATIVILLIQLSELLMKFFVETLGGRDLFNIYFSGTSQETNYKNFIGCRDINLRSQEAVEAEIMLLRMTNVTYYVMGGMLLLRKILLWFLLFVSPFLAILMPFIFIRNTGWIWIGVLFQWLFYGPLFALFLGATAAVWKPPGIPYPFDFSRVVTERGYVFPTGINIAYGGPAQKWTNNKERMLNNGNYVDTFVEYVITLIMLWAVTFFPWWLLRIFRDYCCEGIMAMKNILLSMYDQMRGGGPSPPPPPGPVPFTAPTGTTFKTPQKIDVPVTIKTRETVHLERIEDVRRAKTEDITRSMNIQATSLTDIARFETDRASKETVTRNIAYLQNPMRAETPTERQQFMNVKSELSTRAIREDKVASRILNSVSTSRVEQIKHKEELIQSISAPQRVAVTNVISVKVKLPQEKVASVTSTFVSEFNKDTVAVNSVSQVTQVPAEQVKKVLTKVSENADKTPQEAVRAVEQDTGLKQEKVAEVLKKVRSYVRVNRHIVEKTAEKQQVKAEVVEKTIDAQIPLVAEPERHVEATIAIPPSVSIEDYEEVKKMWKDHYVRGEVPTSPTIKSREQWLEQDTVFITNTMNKLLSADPKLKEQGLDDLGYILPVFMINNFKGDELLVYLRAKLEAAHEVAEQTEREREVTEKLKAQVPEEFVEVPETKIEEKARELQQELKMETPEEEKPKQEGENIQPQGVEPAEASQKQPGEPEAMSNATPLPKDEEKKAA